MVRGCPPTEELLCLERISRGAILVLRLSREYLLLVCLCIIREAACVWCRSAKARKAVRFVPRRARKSGGPSAAGRSAKFPLMSGHDCSYSRGRKRYGISHQRGTLPADTPLLRVKFRKSISRTTKCSPGSRDCREIQTILIPGRRKRGRDSGGEDNEWRRGTRRRRKRCVIRCASRHWLKTDTEEGQYVSRVRGSCRIRPKKNLRTTHTVPARIYAGGFRADYV